MFVGLSFPIVCDLIMIRRRRFFFLGRRVGPCGCVLFPSALLLLLVLYDCVRAHHHPWRSYSVFVRLILVLISLTGITLPAFLFPVSSFRSVFHPVSVVGALASSDAG